MSSKEIKPTCSGKLLSSYFDLTVQLNFDVACECCSQSPVVSLRIVTTPCNADDLPKHTHVPITFNLHARLDAQDDAELQLRPA
jgi:NAD-dependent oxidoreductase involved in siderophore biosynthesis